MKTFYIEVYHPCYPNKGRKVRIFRHYDVDALSPTLTHLYRVQAYDKADALALALDGQAYPMISPNRKVS